MDMQDVYTKYATELYDLSLDVLLVPNNYNEIMAELLEFSGTYAELKAKEVSCNTRIEESLDRANVDLKLKANVIRVNFKNALRQVYGLNLSIQQTDALYVIAKGDLYKDHLLDIEIAYVHLVDAYFHIRNLEVM